MLNDNDILGKTYDVSPYDLQRSHPSMILGVKLDLCVLFVQTAVKMSGLVSKLLHILERKVEEGPRPSVGYYLGLQPDHYNEPSPCNVEAFAVIRI